MTSGAGYGPHSLSTWIHAEMRAQECSLGGKVLPLPKGLIASSQLRINKIDFNFKYCLEN